MRGAHKPVIVWRKFDIALMLSGPIAGSMPAAVRVASLRHQIKGAKRAQNTRDRTADQ
jgi:hypothetical protein